MNWNAPIETDTSLEPWMDPSLVPDAPTPARVAPDDDPQVIERGGNPDRHGMYLVYVGDEEDPGLFDGNGRSARGQMRLRNVAS